MRLHKSRLKTAVTAATLVLAASGANAMNLITNGSFEDAKAGVTAPVAGTHSSLGTGLSSGNINGWEVFNDTLAWISGPLQGLTAQNQVRFLDLTDTQQSNPFGGIRQTVSLAANTNYNLSFWLGTSTAFNGNTTVQVLIGTGNTASFQSAPSTGLNTWIQKTASFNSGAGGNTTISILGWVGQDYIGIDNVSLTAAVPEPSSLAMLFAGLAAVGSVVARRRKSA